MPKKRGGKTHHDVSGDLIDEYLKIIGSTTDVIDDVLIGKITNHYGSGRFQVNLYSNNMDLYPEKQCVLCGRLRARFNRSNPDNRLNSGVIVLVQNNGVAGGREFEIVGVFKSENLKILKAINKNLFEILTKNSNEASENDGEYEFEEECNSDSESEINIDNI